jgi:hypothetical protein
MATLCKTYSTEVRARRAVKALRAARVPGRVIRLLTGCELHDVRREPIGGFAGAVGPSAPVGTYSGGVRPHREGRGGFAGDSDQRRRGSFGDVDRCMIVTYEGGSERSRVVGDLGIRRLLRGSTFSGDTADRVADELHMGHAVVLVEVTGITARNAHGRLEEVARAACAGVGEAPTTDAGQAA